MEFEFKETKPRVWTGRYARIPGDTPVFHLKTIQGSLTPVVYLCQDDERATCHACNSKTVQKLSVSVSSAKQLLSGHSGGSFQINEFGQVLVPASGTYKRMLVGEVSGELRFHNPFEEGETFSLNDDDGLKTGDEWPGPYVGMPYNLNGRSRIYYWLQGAEDGRSVYPPCQDHELIRRIRAIRRSGAVKFIVNYCGIVLTKIPPPGEWTGDEEMWTPVYVGRINYAMWFQKED